MKDLIIIGSGGLGREAIWIAERMNAHNPEWNILGFIDDNPELSGTSVSGYPILGTTADVVKYPDAYYVCAIGNAKARKLVTKKARSFAPIKFATLIDPTCIFSNKVTFGEGCVVCAYTYITVDIKIGNHVYIGANCTVGHDAVVDDFVTLYPSVTLSGNTHIASGCELGTGSQVIQGLTVESNTIVGAGSAVIRNLPSDCTAVGVPALPIKYHRKKA